VLAHGRELDAAGAGEVVLTGIHLGAYGKDLVPPVSLQALLERLLEESSGARLRLSSIEPQEITPRLIELAAHHPRVCRHFHIPLQSGDDEILRRMGRPYDSALIRNLVKRILSAAAETCIGFDVMVGFPGEDERSFQRTAALIHELEPAYLHVFPFSPRPGTPAAAFAPRVPTAIARERVEELRDLSKRLRSRFYERFVGATLMAVPESDPDHLNGILRARTDNYIPVTVQGTRHSWNERAFPIILQRVVDGEVHGACKQS
jgi:threonylcarbamoyladenosine tRNA methylthiotransferase MtaB